MIHAPRRAFSLASIAVLALMLLVVPQPAQASTVVGGSSVDELLDIPSRAARTVGNGSWANQLWYTYFAALSSKPVGTPGTVTVTPPKPVAITPATAMTRGVAAAGNPAGVALTGFGVGFAVGQGGLAVYAAATGSTYNDMICNTPDWYQGATSFMMMGLAPDCKGLIAEAQRNADASGGVNGSACYQGWCVNLTHVVSAYVTGQPTQPARLHCGTLTGTAPAGVTRVIVRGPGQTTTSGTSGGACPAGTTNVGGNAHRAPFGPSPGFRIYRVSDNQTLADFQPGFADLSANPTRTPSCKIRWQDGSETTGTGTAYTENDGIPMSSAGMGCEQAYVSKPGAGVDFMPDRITVGTQDGSGNPVTVLDSDAGDPPTQAEKIAMDPSRGNGHGLVLETLVNGTWRTCHDWAVSCAGWWDTSGNGSTTDRYRCTFGGASVALVECGAYRNTFETQTSKPVITDPAGGTHQWGSSSKPGNSINPGTGPGTTPGDQCMSQWSMAPNPIEWILHPIKCALVWAFVPRPEVVTTAQGNMGTAYENSTIGALAASAAGLSGVFNAQSGCAGLPFDFVAFGVDFHGRLFEACSEPWAGVASFVKNVSAGVILVGGFLAVIRYGAGVFGFVGLGMGVGDRQDGGGGGVRFK